VVAEGVIRVVVADDHPMFRRGLCATLADLDGIEVVDAVGDGDAAIQSARTHRPDVVLMDLAMPGTDGRTACHTITAEFPEIAVLVLTMSDDADAIGASLRAGAKGYLLKGADEAAIARALHTVAAGDFVLSNLAGVPMIDALTRSRPSAGPFPKLSSRERQVLDLVARGLGNIAIARQLSLSDKTVRNQVSNIIAKIGASDRADAIDQARRAGLGTTSHRAI
jgi:DNA-binding NarL/FixJ family response regulator